jgi:hypothetical protein
MADAMSASVDFEGDTALFCRFPQSVALVLDFAKVNDHLRETILRDTCWTRRAQIESTRWKVQMPALIASPPFVAR